MRLVITGGNGFLGSAMTRKFLQEGHSVLVFSKNSNNIHDILDKVTYYSCNTKDLINYHNEIADFKPDVVIHCGWSGGNNYGSTSELSQYYDNVGPSIQFLEFLNTLSKKPKFVGFGSFAEYGRHNTIINELSQTDPANLYGLTKLMFMQSSKMLCGMWNTDWMWIRPCYVYGPGDVTTRIIPSLIAKFVKNESVILDECTSTIDYLYIDDFVNQIYILIVNNATGIYNLCSGNQYRIKDIVEYLHKATNSTSDVVYDPKLNRTTISNYVCGDATKLVNETKQQPSTTIEEGLNKTITYYKNL